MNQIKQWITEGECELLPIFADLDQIALTNQRKVLAAFRQLEVSDYHLQPATGMAMATLVVKP
jgi:cystathionine beta-lyase family protein involved in aluminum resistance